MIRNRVVSKTALTSVDECQDRKKQKNKVPALQSVVVGLVVFALTVSVAYFRHSSTAIERDVVNLSSNIKVRIDFDTDSVDGGDVALGPHKVSVTIDDTVCQTNRPNVIWMRLEGDALVAINLREEPNNKQVWSGIFTIPFEGSYRIVAHWYGCDGYEQGTKKQVTTLHEFHSKGLKIDDGTRGKQSSLHPDSTWIASNKFTQTNSMISQPYIWMDPSKDPSNANLLISEGTIVAEEGTTTTENGFYQFAQLSNYELVCWVGSDSATKIYHAFRNLRPQIASSQRPFKFHIYPTKDFAAPDQSWPKQEKERFRKCKHILVSVDELEKSLSQTEYLAQVETFLKHLIMAFPDKTFPIWMFTVNESPLDTTNCHSPTLPRSSDHPCNVALKSFFEKQIISSPRVKLMDNTDLTLPQLGDNEEDIMAVIALRIFVMVGKRVEEWRAAGQKGTEQGLIRGNKTEPNFELVPYTGWSQK